VACIKINEMVTHVTSHTHMVMKKMQLNDDTWHREFENDYAMWCRCAKDVDMWPKLNHLDFNMWF
jgi:hypothetical protein